MICFYWAETRDTRPCVKYFEVVSNDRQDSAVLKQATHPCYNHYPCADLGFAIAVATVLPASSRSCCYRSRHYSLLLVARAVITAVAVATAGAL